MPQKFFSTRFERSENRVYFTRISKVGKCAAFDFGPLKSRGNSGNFVKNASKDKILHFQVDLVLKRFLTFKRSQKEKRIQKYVRVAFFSKHLLMVAFIGGNHGRVETKAQALRSALSQ